MGQASETAATSMHVGAESREQIEWSTLPAQRSTQELHSKGQSIETGPIPHAAAGNVLQAV